MRKYNSCKLKCLYWLQSAPGDERIIEIFLVVIALSYPFIILGRRVQYWLRCTNKLKTSGYAFVSLLTIELLVSLHSFILQSMVFDSALTQVRDVMY